MPSNVPPHCEWELSEQGAGPDRRGAFPPAKAVGERSRWQQQRGKAQEIGTHDPLNLGEGRSEIV
jgi:hypothetical protein